MDQTEREQQQQQTKDDHMTTDTTQGHRPSLQLNKHTHTYQKAATDQDIRHNHYVHRKLHQGTQILHNIIEITHPQNVNSQLAFHKVVSIHQHYSTFTLQTYHHTENRFGSWPTHMTSPSHLHTQSRVQPRNTYNHTYIKFLSKQFHTKSRQNNLYSVHSRPYRI